jgi:DNA modification methylase
MNFYKHAVVPVDALIPYALNSRTHSDAQVAQLAASIREFGFTNPILVDEQSNLIAGHGRLLAARKLGLTEVPAVVVTGMDDRKRRALIIADNKLALNAGWDEEALRVEMEDLGADYGELMGFSQEELSDILNAVEPTEGLTDEDAVPELPSEPVTKPGDVWLLGKHRVMCGDSTSIDAVENLMAGEKADFCFTSPPYNAGDSEKLSGNTHTIDNKYGLYRDDKTQSDYLDLLSGFCSAWMTACGCMCVNIQQLAGNKLAFVEWMYNFRGHLIDVAIWDKGHGAPQMARNVMSNRFEYLVFLNAKENPSRSIPSADFQGTVQNVYSGPPQRDNEFSSIHAATFPMHLPEWAVNTFTGKQSTVCDPFGGTGTTLVACEKTGRTARLMELDPKYVDVIVKRWQDFTGKQATLEATGETYDALAKEEA